MATFGGHSCFGGKELYILYIDESGDLGAMPINPLQDGNDQPAFIIGALIVDARKIKSLTHCFLQLKSKFYPGLKYPSSDHLDKIIPEIKGADIRRHATRGSRRSKRHAIGFLDNLIKILEEHDVKILSRIWIKGLGQDFKGTAVYTSSIQWLYTSFENFLDEQTGFGFCIADSRDYMKNVNVAHSVFTQKFRVSPSVYNRILELPTFGHSDNHAGIQICYIQLLPRSIVQVMSITSMSSLDRPI